ncbi:MAG: sulfite exporter TauE/SafE family protein [Bacteroidota bacterium]
MYLPIADAVVNPIALVVIGFCVGILGGFFGVGGAFMVTPALNIFGFPMAYAIGTDVAHIFGKSIVSTYKHALLKHVDWKLGAVVGLLGMFGVNLGKDMVLYLEKVNLVGPIVRIVYMLLLFTIGGLMLMECLSKKAASSDRDEAGISRVARRIRGLKIPPVLSFPQSGIESVSIWAVVLLGVFTGFVSGFLGVGGGFVRVPMFIYLLGLPTVIAVGTDLLAILISNAWGAYIYATAGKVELVGAAVMLLGAGVGAQLGSLATAFIKGMQIRLYFAITVLLAGASVVLKQFGLDRVAGYLMLGSALALSAWILILLVREVAAGKRRIEASAFGEAAAGKDSVE